MTMQPTLEEFNALREAMALLQSQRDSLRFAHESLVGENRVLRVERDLLKERLAKMMHKMFAAKSEARGTEQTERFFNEAEPQAAATQAAPAQEESGPGPGADADPTDVAGHKRKRGRKPLDPALPRQVERHELPESERICPHDGATLTEIGVEVSEQIEVIPQQVRVIRHERVKYACPCCDGALRLAPKPAQIIPKGLFTAGAVAWVITAKYQDGLPLYRQAALLGRFGGDISRNTLAGSLVRVGAEVQPIINLLRDQLLDAEIIHGDETELQVLKEPGRYAQQKSYLWAQMSGSGTPIRLFTYAPSRSAETARRHYDGARGALVTDGYEVYAIVAQTYGLVHLGCWAHARRRFVDAEAALPKAARTSAQPAAQFIAVIGELYAIEAAARELGAEERLRLRHERSRPVLARIQALLLAHLHSVLPGSLLGQ